jgi:hypothetical protein
MYKWQNEKVKSYQIVLDKNEYHKGKRFMDFLNNIGNLKSLWCPPFEEDNYLCDGVLTFNNLDDRDIAFDLLQGFKI